MMRRLLPHFILGAACATFSVAGCSSDDETVPETCEGGTFADSAGACIAFDTCTVGEFVSAQGTLTSDRVCAPCADGTFSDVENAASCAPVSVVCAAGEYVVSDADAASDRSCASCDAGYFSSGQNAASCVPQEDCDPGTYVSADAPGADRACTVCEEGTYSENTNDLLCTAWSVCTANQLERAHGSSTKDLICVDGAWAKNVGVYGHLVSSDDIALGPNGLSYLAALTLGAVVPDAYLGGRDAVLVAHQSDGTEAWRRQFGTENNDMVWGVAVDDAGGVYVTGATEGAFTAAPNAGDFDLFIVKFNADGDEVWRDQFGTSSYDSMRGIAVRGETVYLAGMTEGALAGTPNAGDRDAFVRTYGVDGVEGDTFQFGTSGSDVLEDIAVDDEGGIYVVGRTTGAFAGETNSGEDDAFVLKLSDLGVTEWVRQFGGSSSDRARGVSVRGAGDDAEVYVVGHGVNVAGLPALDATDALLFAYAGDGTLRWARNLGANTSAVDVVLGEDGAVHVAAETDAPLPGISSTRGTGVAVREYDREGATVWTTQFGTLQNDFIGGMDIDGDGALYISGMSTQSFPGEAYYGGNQSAFVVKLPAIP